MSELPYIPSEENYFLSIEDMISQIAQGIANAQRNLDEQAIELQKKIFTDPELRSLRDAGIQATWYRIPEVTATIKVTITSHTEGEESGSKTAPFLFLSPYNATYKNSFELDYQGMSEISFKIVPVPQPISASSTSVPNVIGKLKVDAEKALQLAGLVLGNVSEEVSGVTPGTVIKQYPEQNFSAIIGSSVDIVVSKKE